MNQIFNFMGFLAPLILEGRKIKTTRLLTEFRLKCDVGDLMYLYTGLRTKHARKLGDALVVGRWIWNQAEIYNGKRILEDKPSPTGVSWSQFAYEEGFNNVGELVAFFNQKRYRDKDLITYEYRLKKKGGLDKWIIE